MSSVSINTDGCGDEGSGCSPRSKIPVPRLQRTSSLRLGKRNEVDRNSGVQAQSHAAELTSANVSKFQQNHSHKQQHRKHSVGSLSFPANLSSHAVSKAGVIPTTPTPSPDNDDDADSVLSFASGASWMSCDRPTSTRASRLRYAIHCPTPHESDNQYLTPTQRAQREVKHLKLRLDQAYQQIHQKDTDILKLTKELVDLRMFKASKLSEQRLARRISTSHFDPDCLEQNQSEVEDNLHELRFVHSTSSPSPSVVSAKHHNATPSSVDGSFSLTDSGHFDDINASRTCSTSTCRPGKAPSLTAEVAVNTDESCIVLSITDFQNIREQHNQKVEDLLKQISDVNTAYSDMRSDLKEALSKIESLEFELNEANIKQQEMNLKVFQKGQAVAHVEDKCQKILSHESMDKNANLLSMPELLQQFHSSQNNLDNDEKVVGYAAGRNLFEGNRSVDIPVASETLLSTSEAVSLWMVGMRKGLYKRIIEDSSRSSKQDEMDPAVLLQFLRSAVYYLLTDPVHRQGHLRAVTGILGYTPEEQEHIKSSSGFDGEGI